MLIVDEGALEFEFIREDDTMFFVQVQITSFYHSVQEPIIMHTKPHGLTDNNINLSIKILPRKNLNNILKLIFLNNLLHHPNILLLRQRMPIYYTIYFSGPGFSSVNRVVTVATGCKVQDDFISEKVRVVSDCVVIGFECALVLEQALELL
jgi:hypothetical protein